MPDDLNVVLLKLLSSPNIASKQWVYRQYDHMVRTNNVVLSEGDAAVVLLRESNKALSVKTDCNARYVYLNPYRGGMIAVAEAARNVVCTGAEPLAITNCLNFGNPYKPEVYWQFREAVRGIGDACKVLDTPVTGGNVSFYNEGPSASVFPTPVIGMMGVIDDLSNVTTSGFKSEGDAIIVIGKTSGHIGGSEYLQVTHGLLSGDAPHIDMEYEKRVQQACLAAIRRGIVKSAHDCAEGGLAVAIAESCILGSKGASVRLRKKSLRDDFQLFGEDQSRIVLTTSHAEELLALCSEMNVDAERVGTVGGIALSIEGVVNLNLSEMTKAYYYAIENAMDIL
jgi:phosphoribosylformylglycinamidine synthase